MAKKLLGLFLTGVLLLPAVLYGQSKVGTAGAQFLEIAPSARVAGMGEAFVAIADDASALFYNPAGLAWLPKNELLANGTQYPADINLYYAGFVRPIPKYGVLGGSFTALGMDDMPVTTPFYPDSTGEYFTCAEYALQLTYSRMLTERFATGVTIRYIQSYLEEEGASGIAGDVGTLYDTRFKTIKMGMSISNFGPDLTYLKESFPLPMNFKVGLSFAPIYDEKNLLVMCIEGQHPNHNVEQAAIGGEYSYRNTFFVRAGYKIKYDAETWSAGVGFKIPVGPREIKLDAAYTDFGFLNDIKRISFGMAF